MTARSTPSLACSAENPRAAHPAACKNGQAHTDIRAGAEDVAMRIAGQLWQLELRRARVRIGRRNGRRVHHRHHLNRRARSLLSSLAADDRPPPYRHGLIERRRLEGGDGGLHQLLDGAGGIAAVGLAARQARDAIRRHQRVIECAEQEVAAPTMSVRGISGRLSWTASMKAWLVSSKVCAMIFRTTSLPSADITARSRVKRAPAPGEIAARGEGRHHIGAHDRLQPVLEVAPRLAAAEQLETAQIRLGPRWRW